MRTERALLLTGNVLFAAGLVAHAFLFNFYLREIQLTPSVMGHQVAAMTLGGFVALLPAGAIIDRLGIRWALLAGVAVTVVGLTLTAVAHDVAVIYAAAAVIGVGGATCRVSWGPAIMRLTTSESRARIFSLNVALLIGSGSVWTWLSGESTKWLAGYSVAGLTTTQTTLLAGAVLTASAALCYAPLSFPRESASAASGRDLRLPRGLSGVVACVAVWMVAAALVLPFFNIFFSDRFGMSVPRIGTLFAIIHAVTAVALLGAGELAKSLGPRRAFAIWSVALAPALLLLMGANALWLAVALYFIQGIVAPATNPLIDQMLLERAPAERHGVVSAWRNAAAEGAGAIGASAGGRIIEGGSFSVLFVAAGVVAGLSALALNALLRPRRNAIDATTDASIA